MGGIQPGGSERVGGAAPHTGGLAGIKVNSAWDHESEGGAPELEAAARGEVLAGDLEPGAGPPFLSLVGSSETEVLWMDVWL